MNLTCSGSSRRRARSPCTNALDRQLVAAQLPYGSRFRLIKARGGRAALPSRLLQLPPLSLLLFSAKGPPAFPTAFSACADSLCTSFTEVALLYMPHCTIALLDLLHHHRTANKVRQNGEHLETLAIAISPSPACSLGNPSCVSSSNPAIPAHTTSRYQ